MVIGEWYWKQSPAYYMSWVCLIIGLAGIVMMAVDIVKAIKELGAWLAKTDALARKQAQNGQKESQK